MESILNLIPAVMGLGLIDENLEKLLSAMQKDCPALGLGVIMNYAKAIGLGIALGVGANECYQMILGRRGLDVMKILHIIIISLCISSAGWIADVAAKPGLFLEGISKSAMQGMAATVDEKEKTVATAHEIYIEKVRENMQKMEEAQKAANANDDSGILDQIGNVIEEQVAHIGNIIKEYTLVAETKICEWISLILRLIGEVLLQAMYYGLLVSQRIFMHLLAAFGPLMFAMSLSPHYKSAWSQWLSKYISLSLWGFVTYACLYYVYYILWYNLDQDIAAYTKLTGDISKDDYNIAAIGMQAVGSTCMYLVGLLVGIKVLAFVPEVASWLIPGGVSSGSGGAVSSTVMGGASMAAGAAMTAGSVAAGAGGTTAGAIGHMAQVPGRWAINNDNSNNS